MDIPFINILYTNTHDFITNPVWTYNRKHCVNILLHYNPHYNKKTDYRFAFTIRIISINWFLNQINKPF